jgi:hypothetical protein
VAQGEQVLVDTRRDGLNVWGDIASQNERSPHILVKHT